MSKLLVLVGSTHVGGFNDRLADLAVRELERRIVAADRGLALS